MWATTYFNKFFSLWLLTVWGKAKETSVDVQSPALFNISLKHFFFARLKSFKKKVTKREMGHLVGLFLNRESSIFYLVERIPIFMLYKGEWTGQNDGQRTRLFSFNLALLYRFAPNLNCIVKHTVTHQLSDWFWLGFGPPSLDVAIGQKKKKIYICMYEEISLFRWEEIGWSLCCTARNRIWFGA